MLKNFNNYDVKDIVRDAYSGAVMTEEEKINMKDNLLKKNRRIEKMKTSYKVGIVVAVAGVFLAINATIIGISMKHDNISNKVVDGTQDTNSVSQTFSESETQNLTDVKIGDIIYTTNVNPIKAVTSQDGTLTYSYSDKKYKVQVVVSKLANEYGEILNNSMNNDKLITGEFEIQVIDNDGSVVSSCKLENKKSTAYGITLNRGEENMEEAFGAGADSELFIYKNYDYTRNGVKRYIASLYGVDENGKIYVREKGFGISENFAPIPNKAGMWEDFYYNGMDDVDYNILKFPQDSSRIKVPILYVGKNTGDDVEEALLAFKSKYEKPDSDGVLWELTDWYVSQKVDDNNSDVYCKIISSEGMLIAQAKMIKTKEGKWQVSELKEISIQ